MDREDTNSVHLSEMVVFVCVLAGIGSARDPTWCGGGTGWGIGWNFRPVVIRGRGLLAGTGLGERTGCRELPTQHALRRFLNHHNRVE